jgi:hypothetical protein
MALQCVHRKAFSLQRRCGRADRSRESSLERRYVLDTVWSSMERGHRATETGAGEEMTGMWRRGMEDTQGQVSVSCNSSRF